MAIYHVTAFEKKGGKLLDKTLEAINEHEAKEKAISILTENDLIEKTHRCVSPSGQLILFHR